MLFIVALALRLLYVLGFPQLPVASDAGAYDLLAQRWASGQGFPGWEESGYEIDRLPLYVIFLGTIYAVTGSNPMTARAAQAVMWAVIVLLTYRLADHVMNNRRVAVCAAAIITCVPVTIAYAGLLMTETLFTLILLVASLSLFTALRLQRSRWYFWTGVSLGFTALVSSRVQYLPLVLLASLLLMKHEKRKVLRWGVALLAGFVLTVLPWTVRSSLVARQFVFLSTYQHDKSLWLAFHKDGPTELDYMTREPFKSLGRDVSPSERQRLLRHEALRQLRRYPFHYVKNVGRRFLHLWFASHGNTFVGLQEASVTLWRTRQWEKLSVKGLLFLIHSSIVLLGFWGLYVCRRSWRQLVPLYVPLVYLTALHALFVTSPRFQIPMWPYLSIFAVRGLFHLSGEGRVAA